MTNSFNSTSEPSAISLEQPEVNYGIPLEDFNDVQKLRSIVEHLYRKLDNIDTLSDICKNSDKCFRNQTLKEANSRHEVIQTDGYALFIK